LFIHSDCALDLNLALHDSYEGYLVYKKVLKHSNILKNIA